jgi:small redox-active disulfide protein 2
MHKIEILGMGCAKCNKLEELARKASDELGIEYEVQKVKDIDQIMDYGVMITPALVIDGQVKVAGKVPSYEEVKKMVESAK